MIFKYYVHNNSTGRFKFCASNKYHGIVDSLRPKTLITFFTKKAIVAFKWDTMHPCRSRGYKTIRVQTEGRKIACWNPCTLFLLSIFKVIGVLASTFFSLELQGCTCNSISFENLDWGPITVCLIKNMAVFLR